MRRRPLGQVHNFTEVKSARPGWRQTRSLHFSQCHLPAAGDIFQFLMGNVRSAIQGCVMPPREVPGNDLYSLQGRGVLWSARVRKRYASLEMAAVEKARAD